MPLFRLLRLQLPGELINKQTHLYLAPKGHQRVLQKPDRRPALENFLAASPHTATRLRPRRTKSGLRSGCGNTYSLSHVSLTPLPLSLSARAAHPTAQAPPQHARPTSRPGLGLKAGCLPHGAGEPPRAPSRGAPRGSAATCPRRKSPSVRTPPPAVAQGARGGCPPRASPRDGAGERCLTGTSGTARPAAPRAPSATA